ncbi:hypothetical protein AHAS_Ahas09G0070300 [Arachis hypogaea]
MWAIDKELALEEVKSFTSNKKELHNFKGTEDISSLWCEHYPFALLSKEHAQSPADVKLKNDVGDVELDWYLQVIGARLMCRTHELKHRNASLNMEELNKLVQDKVEKEKEL